MASQTTNLNLKKPALDDDALITDINNNMDLIDTYAGTTNGKINATNALVGIVATGSTAPKAISKGQYVIWNGALYTAKSAISSGTTLSSSNLQSVSDGGLNSIRDTLGSITEIGNVASPTSTSDTQTVTLSSAPSTFRYIMIGNFYSNTGNVCYTSTILPYSVFSKAVGNLSAHRLGAYNGASLKFWLGSNNVLNFTLNESTQMPGGYVIVYGIY